MIPAGVAIIAPTKAKNIFKKIGVKGSNISSKNNNIGANSSKTSIKRINNNAIPSTRINRERNISSNNKPEWKSKT
jgi:hypothetical protein